MPQKSYPYAVGRVRALETKVLDEVKWNRLYECTEREALRLIVDAGYGRQEAEDIEQIISFEQQKLREEIYELTPDAELTNLFYLQYDAHNLKVLLKSRLLKTEPSDDMFERGTFNVELIKVCVDNYDYSMLPNPLRTCLTQLEEDLSQEHWRNPRLVSAAVDNAIFRHRFSILDKKKNPLVLKYFTAQVDFANVLSMLRARALGWNEGQIRPMLIDGGEIDKSKLISALDANDESLSGILGSGSNWLIISSAVEEFAATGSAQRAESVFTLELMKVAQSERYSSFEIGPIVSYMLLRDNEALKLRELFANKRSEKLVQ